MAIIPTASILLLSSVAMMLSAVEQAMLIGSVICGAVFGALFQTFRSLKEREADAPRHIIIYRFISHTSSGSMFGSAGCFALVYWAKVEAPLILMGVAVGSLCGWLGEKAAKRYEPRLLDILENSGRIVRPLSKDAKTITISPDTVNLSPETKKMDEATS